MNRKIITIDGVEFYQIGYAGGEQYYYQQGLDPNPDQLIKVDFATYKEIPDTRSLLEKIQQDGEHIKVDEKSFWKYESVYYKINDGKPCKLDRTTLLTIYPEILNELLKKYEDKYENKN